MTDTQNLHTAIARGIDRGLRDLGADVTGCTPSMLTGHVIRELRAAGLHPAEQRTHAAPVADERVAELPEDWREQVHDVFYEKAHHYESARALIVDLIGGWHIATARKLGQIEEV